MILFVFKNKGIIFIITCPAYNFFQRFTLKWQQYPSVKPANQFSPFLSYFMLVNKIKQINLIKTTVLLLALTCSIASSAQIPDHIYKPNIHAVKLFRAGDIYSYPVINLNGAEVLELHFDDMEAGVKNYYYTFQLCNADWSVAALQSFDYITGFQSNRITTYRSSSIALTRYTHYQAALPDRNCKPSRSGNYLLKVFLNNDTSKLVFTKRMMVLSPDTSCISMLFAE